MVAMAEILFLIPQLLVHPRVALLLLAVVVEAVVITVQVAPAEQAVLVVGEPPLTTLVEQELLVKEILVVWEIVQLFHVQVEVAALEL
jgi:hypothetical protein